MTYDPDPSWSQPNRKKDFIISHDGDYLPNRSVDYYERKIAAIDRDRERYKTAILNCLEWANGHEDEWGDRAINAFAFLEAAVNPIPESDESIYPEPKT